MMTWSLGQSTRYPRATLSRSRLLRISVAFFMVSPVVAQFVLVLLLRPGSRERFSGVAVHPETAHHTSGHSSPQPGGQP
jgi:hypothetical protein